jgi:L-methionine (R)-S-oxide reductase
MNIHKNTKPIPNTAEDLARIAVEAFKKLPPEEQERQRKSLYENLTGLPYPPGGGEWPASDALASIQRMASQPTDPTALMAETVALLQRERPHYNWVGIYLLENGELVLGPFVGKPTPHTRIPLNKGICGAAASSGKTVIVDDVNADPRYLACSLETRSEIVVPIMRDGQVLGEIDIDSDKPAAFGEEDRRLLEEVAAILAMKI